MLAIVADMCLMATLAWYGQQWAMGALMGVYALGYAAGTLVRSKMAEVASNWK